MPVRMCRQTDRRQQSTVVERPQWEEQLGKGGEPLVKIELIVHKQHQMQRSALPPCSIPGMTTGITHTGLSSLRRLLLLLIDPSQAWLLDLSTWGLA